MQTRNLACFIFNSSFWLVFMCGLYTYFSGRHPPLRLATVLLCLGFVRFCFSAGGCLDISVFDPYAGYDLNWVGGDGTGLVDYLQAVGWQPTSNIQAGTVCAVFGYDHAVLGVGDGLCAAHNNARWAVGCSDYYGTPDVCLNAP